MSTLAEYPVVVSEPEATIDLARVAIIIPTCNAEPHWAALSGALRVQGIPAGQVLVVDSSSEDRTRELAAAEGFNVYRIERHEFNHGGTRQLAAEMVPWASVAVYLTQDAVPATPDAIEKLLTAFHDPAVAAAYGRQLPRPGAGPIEAHARLFNYPPRSELRDYESRHILGIKAAFLSNSFAAYRTDRLAGVGGFPPDTIMAEDAIVAGRLLVSGWKIAYVAEAQAYHSHPFTVRQEFQRYFDTGVYHIHQHWLPERFGKPGGEGKRFVVSELNHLLTRGVHLVPYALLRTAAKALGYKLGLYSGRLGAHWSKRLSYHKSYWDNPTTIS